MVGAGWRRGQEVMGISKEGCSKATSRTPGTPGNQLNPRHLRLRPNMHRMQHTLSGILQGAASEAQGQLWAVCGWVRRGRGLMWMSKEGGT